MREPRNHTCVSEALRVLQFKVMFDWCHQILLRSVLKHPWQHNTHTRTGVGRVKEFKATLAMRADESSVLGPISDPTVENCWKFVRFSFLFLSLQKPLWMDTKIFSWNNIWNTSTQSQHFSSSLKVTWLGTRPGQTRPGQTGPGQTGPGRTGPDQTRPDQTGLNRARPDQTRLNRARERRGKKWVNSSCGNVLFS